MGSIIPTTASASVITITDGTHTISDNQTGDSFYLNGSNISFTVEKGGAVGNITGNSINAILNNNVTINKGKVKNSIYAGYTNGNADVTSNSVVLIDSEASYVHGGSNRDKEATSNVRSNTVNIMNSSVRNLVYGGVTDGSSTVQENQVIIDNGTIGFIYSDGSFVGSVVAGGAVNSGNGKVINNSVVFNNSHAGWVYGGVNHNEESSSSVENNTVTVNDGVVDHYVYGGATLGNGVVKGNNVEFNSGEVSYIYGGCNINDESFGNVENNTVNITGGTVTIEAIGGITYGSGSVLNNVVEMKNSSTLTLYGGINQNYNSHDNVANNTVTVSNSSVQSNIYGGITNGDGDATGNSVVLNDVISFTVGGGASNGSSIANVVEIVKGHIGSTDSDGTFLGGNVRGGSGGNGNVIDNSVVFDDGEAGKIYGGYASGNALVKNNYIEITDGKIQFGLYGGYTSGDGDVSDNQVLVKNGEIGLNGHDGYVYGGSSYGNGNVQGNSVTLNSGKVGNVYGGINNKTNSTGSVQNNTVTVNDGTVLYDLYGGQTEGDGDVTENYIEVNNGTAQYIIGGYSNGNGNVTGNQILIKSGSTVDYIEGAIAQGNGNATSNQVHIIDSTVSGNIEAGFAAGSGEVSGNMVTLERGTNESVIIGGSSYGSGTVTGNTVNLNESNGETVYGGMSSSGGSGDVTNNTVNVKNSIVKHVIYTGYSEGNGNVLNNHVTIENSKIGYEDSDGTYNGGTVYGGLSFNGDVNNNVIELENTEVGNIYGGSTDTGNVTRNTVALKSVSVDGNVYGGYNTDSTGDVVSGNTLVLSKSDNTVGGVVQNFETIKLAETVEWEPGTTVLKANQFVDNADGTRSLLDITEAETNLAAATSGQMGLLASDTEDDFATLVLKYSGGTEKLSETNPYKVLKSGAETSESKPVNGVKLTYVSSQLVSLDAGNGYKDVLYKVDNIPTKIDLGDMTWGTGRNLEGMSYSFGRDASIDATNLNFGEVTTALSVNDSMTLVENATGITSAITPTAGENKTINIKNYTDSATGITYDATASGNVTAETDAVKYTVNSVTADKITLASQKWGEAAYELPDTWKSSASTEVDASGFGYTGVASTALKANDTAIILNAAGLTTSNPVIGGTDKTVALDYTDDNGIKFVAEASGHIATAVNAINYVVDSISMNSIDLSGWNSPNASVLTDDWMLASDLKIDTDAMTVPTDVASGEEKTILTASRANAFREDNISGSNAYKESDFTVSNEQTVDTGKGVTITGTQSKGVTVGDEGKSLVYKVGKKEVSAINAGAVDWQKGATLLDGSDATYDYSKIAALGTEGFDVAYGDGEPETVAAGDSMTLLKANKTLKDMAEQVKAKDYSFTSVEGVTVNATLTGNLAAKNGAVTYTATENRASKLTFGDVEWKNSGALMTRPSNFIFAGADVDTSKINFYKEMYLEADRTMTLVSDFGDSVGTITGSKYLVGTAFEGEGVASLSGSDLIFTTKTEAGVSEQTHKAVMAVEANMALLATGNEYVDKVMDSLGDATNMGKDGVSTAASIGGGASRYETGSHVNTRTWNAAVAVGRKNETKKGTVEYGIFGEYGKGNYTLHSDVGRSDGDAHYAGGGLMVKFTNKHDVYTEASFRLGRMSDSAKELLRDGAGNAYGYDVHANYIGAHIGVGKVFRYDKDKSLDVYGKYFYTKRDGVEFDAMQHYNLDSVKSSVLRIGARYGTTNKLWNWYGGLAYEYEFDGKAEGTVNNTAIRSASVKGSSVRGELGLRMEASKNSPWQTDISLYGYGGKHRGFGGNISVAYLF